MTREEHAKFLAQCKEFVLGMNRLEQRIGKIDEVLTKDEQRTAFKEVFDWLGNFWLRSEHWPSTRSTRAPPIRTSSDGPPSVRRPVVRSGLEAPEGETLFAVPSSVTARDCTHGISERADVAERRRAREDRGV